MFVRVKKINGYEYLYLVENAREGGRHVQRVVKSLGRRDEVEASGTLDALIEDSFKTAKALLATRPIFHKTDAAIRGHVFCSFLALVLRKELADRLAAHRRRKEPLEWQAILDDLADLSEVEVEQDGRRALLRTAPGPTIDPVCRALGITLPPVFQELPYAPRADAEA